MQLKAIILQRLATAIVQTVTDCLVLSHDKDLKLDDGELSTSDSLNTKESLSVKIGLQKTGR